MAECTPLSCAFFTGEIETKNDFGEGVFDDPMFDSAQVMVEKWKVLLSIVAGKPRTMKAVEEYAMFLKRFPSREECEFLVEVCQHVLAKTVKSMERIESQLRETGGLDFKVVGVCPYASWEIEWLRRAYGKDCYTVEGEFLPPADLARHRANEAVQDISGKQLVLYNGEEFMNGSMVYTRGQKNMESQLRRWCITPDIIQSCGCLSAHPMRQTLVSTLATLEELKTYENPLHEDIWRLFFSFLLEVFMFPQALHKQVMMEWRRELECISEDAFCDRYYNSAYCM